VLAYHGYSPVGVERGDEGLRVALAEDFALAILDVMLPGLDGFHLCRGIRAERPQQPILMLTARGSEEDVLEGFRAGSDDYVTKPFSVAQLMARVDALLRRSGAFTSPEEIALETKFPIGAWEIDCVELRAESTRGASPVELTRRDADLLHLFHRERGRIVSRRTLLREIWGYANPDRVETRSVDMHIAKLRRKLALDARDLLQTVRGEGYRYLGTSD
jgi:DNA-binding response OmpR family regulator